MFKFRLLFFVIFLRPALVHADYAIDDSDYSTLKFSENPAGPVWGPFGSDTGEVLEIRLPNGTMQTVDATQCYDGTYTYAACSTANNCAMQFSFTGSGITIYVLQAGPQGMSASLSIDSGTATTATLGAPPAPQYYIPRVVLFSVQNIPSGTHTAVMSVLDWNGGFSGMMLDYININQAVVATPTTSSSPASSPSPTPSTTPSPTSTQASAQSPTSAGSQTPSQQTTSTRTQTSSVPSSATSPTVMVSTDSVFSFHSSGATVLPSSTSSGNGTSSPNSLSSTSKKTHVAAIAGGVAGGVVGLLALLGLAFCCIRRRRREHEQALNERPSPLLLPPPEARFADTDLATVDPFASLSTNQLSGTMDPLQTWTNSEAGSTLNFAARDPRSSSPITILSHMRVASSGNISSTSSAPVSIGAAAVAATPPDRNTPAPTQLHSPVRPGLAAVPVSYPNEKLRHSSTTPTHSPQQQDAMANLGVAGTRPNAALTDEQADFVNSLFNNNVPAPVVARVLERMLANPQGASSVSVNDLELRAHVGPGSFFPSSQMQMQPPAGGVSWLPMVSDSGDGETTVGTAPPSYDYVQAQ